MKNLFFEHYPIEKDEIDTIWANGIFCYDANVLLNLYRYSAETRSDIFENMEFFIDRTTMTYQACYEYHNNRRDVEYSLIDSYDKIITAIEKITTSLGGELSSYRKHCALDIDKDILNPLKRTTDKLVKNINDKKDKHSSVLDVKEIHGKITTLFTDRVSDAFTEDILKSIYKEGEIRYKNAIPPGFADQKPKKNSTENSKYGDLVIWKHLLEISKRNEKPIVFVTDDRKKDWWDIYRGQTRGALPELHREFKTTTQQNILIYSVEDFMKYAPEHSGIKLSRKAITEIEELRKVDNNRITQPSILDARDILNQMDKLSERTNIWGDQNNHFKSLTEIISHKKAYDSIIQETPLEQLNKILDRYKLLENVKATDNIDDFEDIIKK